MKLLHLADLHIGKQKKEEDTLQQTLLEQKSLLMQAVDMAVRHRVTAVLIAGDVYNRPMPPMEAVRVFDFFLNELSKEHIPVCMVSGNHDPANKLFFGRRLPEDAAIYIAETYRQEVRRVTFADEFGEADIYLLPFFKPQQIRRRMAEEGIAEEQLEDYTEAVRVALKGLPLRKQVRNVLVTHQNVIEDECSCGTEKGKGMEGKTKSTKIADFVDWRVFSAFDYVALGHVHDAGWVGRKTVRHAGSLVDYAFYENGHQTEQKRPSEENPAAQGPKSSATLVTLEAKGNIRTEELPFLLSGDMQETKEAASAERVSKLKGICEETEQVIIRYYMGIECPETAEFHNELEEWKKQPDIQTAGTFQEKLTKLVEEETREYELCKGEKESVEKELANCLSAMEQFSEFRKKKEELEQLLWQQESFALEEEESEEAKRRLFFAKKAVLAVRPLKEAYLAAKKEREELFAMIRSKERQFAAFKEQEERTLLNYQKAQADKSGLERLSMRVEDARKETENVKQRTRLTAQYKEKTAELARKDRILEERDRKRKEQEEEHTACRRAAERLAEIYREGTELEKKEKEIKRKMEALAEQKKQLASYEETKKSYEALEQLLSKKRNYQRELEAENKQRELSVLKEEMEKLSREAAMEEGTMRLLLEYMARPRDTTELPRLDSTESCEREEEKLSEELSKVLLEIEELLKEQTSCLQAKKYLPELEKKMAEEAAATELLQDARQGVHAELQSMEGEIKKLTLLLEVKSEAEAEQQLAGLLAAQEQKKREIAEAEATYSGWDEAKENETAVFEQLIGQKAARARKEQNAEAAYFAALKAAGFDTEAEYERAVLDEAQLEELEQRTLEQEMQILKRKERIRCLKQETAHGVFRDMGFLQKQAEELEKRKAELDDRLSALGSRIETNENIRRRAEGQIKIRKQLQKEVLGQ